MEIDIPSFRQGHVLVRVKATSVNPIDSKMRSGAVPKITAELPAVLHGDVAGIVETVAPDVKDFKVGDEVYGCAGGVRGLGGALAEFMLVDAKLIAKKPTSLTMLESAALPLVSITAWQALFDKANLQKNQNILIHGGLGGVGHIAIQLAKYKGANVFTTVRSAKDIAHAKQLGVDVAINIKEESVDEYVNRLTESKGFDIVFDTVGGENLDRSFQAAALYGDVVTIAARSTHDLSPLQSKSLSLHVVFMLLPLLTGEERSGHGTILRNIASIVEENKLMPMIDKHQFENILTN